MFQEEEEKKLEEFLIQEPTDWMLLSPYDLYSNEVPKVTNIQPHE